MYLCDTIEGAQFKVPQEQSFEDVPEQQQFFAQGKWSLIMFQTYLHYNHTFTLYACMCLEYDGSQVKDMPSFS
jgi:hypothetical protein